MISLLISAIAVLWLLIGLAAVLIMLEIQGHPGKSSNVKGLSFLHRILGFIFILIYVVVSIFMIIRTGGYHQELAIRPLVHVLLALLLLPMLALKWLIVRRFKRFFNYLPVLGCLILTVAFLLSAATSGYVFLYGPKIQHTTVSETDIFDVHLARGLLFARCGKCHALEPVLRVNKDLEGWTKTVNHMAQEDLPNIRPFEIKQIILYLAKRSGEEKTPLNNTGEPSLSGESIVQAKCTPCHNLDRVYSVRMDLAAWEKTIDRMIQHAEEIGKIDFLSEEEKQKIARVLTERK